MNVSDKVGDVVRGAVKKSLGLDVQPQVNYNEERFGDFSTNVAYKLAPQLGKSPAEVATQLSGAINHKDIHKATALNGFLNLEMTEFFWLEQSQNLSRDYLKSNLGRGQKVQVEFISANPTGPLTMANGRGGYAGDVLANILSTTGHEVTREYYVNDAGNQLRQLLDSVLGKTESSAQPAPYSGGYVKDLRQKLMPGIEKLEPTQARSKVAEQVLADYIKPAVKKMGISFDCWFSEFDHLYQNYAQPIQAILKQLEVTGLVEDREGAKWLKGGKSTDRARVLVKSDGQYTYLLVDLAYHFNKFTERGFQRVINLWGADHAGQVDSLKDGVGALGISQPLDVIVFQMVRLIKDGREFKMSKRQGSYVTVDELLEKIHPDVARWFFLSRDFNTHMDFDLNLAQEESQKNPYYYVMYSYVRALSILKNSRSQGLVPAKSLEGVTSLEKSLIRKLCLLPELITELSHSYEVHKLTFYGVELAKIFHDYYEGERIIDLPSAQAASKLCLIEKYAQAMDAYWGVLGITPREKM